MTLENTVDVAWRPERGQWAVEGGNGRAVALGVHSLHDSKAGALQTARSVAQPLDGAVRVVNEEGEPYGPAEDLDGAHSDAEAGAEPSDPDAEAGAEPSGNGAGEEAEPSESDGDDDSGGWLNW